MKLLSYLASLSIVLSQVGLEAADVTPRTERPTSEYRVVRLELNEGLYKRVHERQTLLHNSWLTQVGHKRPSTKAGIPLPKAKQQAKALEKKIQAHLGEL